MPRLCPRCNNPLADDPKCPNCGYRVRLSARGDQRRPGEQDQGMAWQQTTWGKTVIGLVVAQGLWYALMMLARTAVSATGNDAQAWMSSFGGLILMQMMQLVSLVVGGMLAGAGQRRGTFYGTIVGVYNAIFFIVVYVVILKNEVTPSVLFGLLLLQIAFGTAGGFIGSQIWKPIQELAPLPDAPDPKTAGVERLLTTAAKQQRPSVLAGPISWLRVVIGTTVAVIGTVSAVEIFRFILALSEGVTPDTPAQVKLLTFEISALTMFIGGAIGGSNSPNGLKQGLVVGVFSSVFLVGLFLYKGDPTGTDTASSIFKQLFGLDVSESFQRILFTVLAVMPLAISGGWFGGQLLPPLILPPRRKRMLPSVS